MVPFSQVGNEEPALSVLMTLGGTKNKTHDEGGRVRTKSATKRALPVEITRHPNTYDATMTCRFLILSPFPRLRILLTLPLLCILGGLMGWVLSRYNGESFSWPRYLPLGASTAGCVVCVFLSTKLCSS